MPKQNRMPGLRKKRGIWHIEKRCKHAKGGWLRECTGETRRAEAEQYLVRRMADIEDKVRRQSDAVFTFEEAAMRYLEDKAHKRSALDIAIHIDKLLPFLGELSLEQVHDGTIKPFIDYERQRGLKPKSINNSLIVISAILNSAARVWRDEQGRPWLRYAPPRLTRLSAKGHQARPYSLTWDEQTRLFRKLPAHVANPALYGVNTGCREQEICQLQWRWEIKVQELNTSIFVLPETFTKTQTERIVVLNSIASRVISEQRSKHEQFVFTYRGHPMKQLRNSAWRAAWIAASLPAHQGVLKGVHNLRHTFGRRLRAAGVSLETRKALLGHANGDMTTHYSAAEIGELKNAVEKIVNPDVAQTPALTLVSSKSAA